jgi:preprotein translocase subunit SecY
VSTLWRALDLVQGSIQFADAKAATILLIDGAVATVATGRLVDAHSYLQGNYVLIGAVIVGATMWLLSAYNAVQCLRPRIGGEDPISLIYFSHIVRRFPRDFREYQRAAQNELATSDQVVSQLAQQVWANAHIAQRKHSNARLALDFLILTVTLALVVGLELLVRNMI